MTDNIINMPTPMNVLADKIRAAFARTEHGRKEWIEGTLELAAYLAEARSRFPANIPFSHWIVDENLEDMGHQDRAALIQMAADPVLARQVLEETQRSSWQLIWENEMKARLTSASKMTMPDIPAPKIAPEPTPEPVKTEIAPVETAPFEPVPVEPEPVKPAKPVAANLPRIAPDERWLLAKKPNADLVRAHILGKPSRSALADYVLTRGGAPLWDLLIHAIKAGYYGPPAPGTKSPGLHLVLPWLGDTSFTRSFDLRDAHSRKDVEETVFPLLDSRPELRLPENHDQIEALVKAERRRIADERHQAAKLERHQRVVENHSFAADEQTIIAFGEPLWPQDTPRYSYKELCHAWWYVKFWIKHNDNATLGLTPAAIAMQGRHQIKYLEPIAPNVVLAIYDILNAYQQNPDGEKKFPLVPVNFGH